MAVCQGQTSSRRLCLLYCLMLRSQSTLSIVLSLLPTPVIIIIFLVVILLRFLLKIKLSFLSSSLLILATNYRETRKNSQYLGIFLRL